jgi:alkanesulfonate monooxygenase SsuD/methylene tetrahydromethanopterin reductase-like flavin-dependent oxidoreductase (luciferase family)
MKIGLCIPYMKEGLTRRDFLAWFRRVDQGPFHALSCGERITGPTYDMRILLSAAAAVTERVRLNASLYVLPMHNAVRAAKEIASLDVLCDGRLTVTVGVGGREMDYQAVGARFTGRFARMDEQVAQMRRIWAGEPPFTGADPVGPKPVQSGGPPILAGVMGPKSMARVAHWSDGLYAFSMNGEREEISRMLSMADTAWQRAGRDTPPYRLGGCWFSLATDSEQRLRQYVYDYLKISGHEIASLVADSMTRHNPVAVSEALDNMEAAGCEEVFLVPATAELAEIDALEQLLAER